jgi:hypothetical protein
MSSEPYRSHPELERLRAMYPDVVLDEEMRARLAKLIDDDIVPENEEAPPSQ